MSDISTSLSMPGSELFSKSEIITCSIFNLKMFLFVLFIIICMSCLSSSINSLFVGTTDIQQDDCDYTEDFSNDQMFSYKDTINPSYSDYQSTALTSDSNNLIFGQANRYSYPGTDPENIGKNLFRIEIYASLYVLNGDPFGKNSPPQKYSVYLKNTKSGERIPLGQLKKDGDGVYKLKFNSNDLTKYIGYNEVQIVYNSIEKETVLLNGKFTLR